MRLRARHVPAFFGLVATGCAAGSILALFTPIGVAEVGTSWSFPLWFAAGVAAVAALPLGLAFDRRGPSIPLALIALIFMLIPVALMTAGSARRSRARFLIRRTGPADQDQAMPAVQAASAAVHSRRQGM
jgi:hypothetical protein